MIVATKGAELYYSTRGNGPPCLVLSGIGTRPCKRQMPAQLSDDVTLVFVEADGLPASPRT